jgi:hypothetical protein
VNFPQLTLTKISIAVVITIFSFSTTFALRQASAYNKESPEEILHFQQFFLLNQQVTPTTTIIFNLPIIEQNSPIGTPVPPDEGLEPEVEIETITNTPTATPIPVQTGSVNLPIVLGALAIILVIILAWFFVGFLPSKTGE